MNAIDYPALLAQLEQQRAASVQEIADLDVIIAAVRKRAGVAVPVGLTLPPARNGGGKNGQRNTRGNPHDPKWNQSKRDYAAGKPVAEIAKAAGVSVATIYTRASEGQWKRPPATAAHAATPSEAGATRLSPDKLATIQLQYEKGVSGPEIEKRTGVSMKTIYKRAKDLGWKRHATAPPAKPTAAAPTPKGTQLSGSVKCTNPDCGVMTDFDPCRRCGVKLNRKGW